jgi:gliding motility-associated-like protein
MNRSLLIFILFTFSIISKAQITVTDASTAQELAQKLVGNGVTISNATFTGNFRATGFFKSKNSPIQIDSGIVLTSGLAKTKDPLSGPYGVNGKQTFEPNNQNGLSGDLQLTSAAGQPTNDASILEFDFVPLGDTISFNYVFSSEEYPEYACTEFNDIFAFFISGPGIAGIKNIAIIPGTNFPVTINNINNAANGNPTFCTNGNTFSYLYINNTGGNMLTHDGLTVKLKAISAVTPCLTYHLKIAIADAGAGDFMLDSGVFIEANSLNSNAVKADIVGSLDPTTNSYYLAEGCIIGTVVFTKPFATATPTVIPLVITGTATNGVDATLIPNSITIPPNQLTASFPITAFLDNLVEGTETLNIYITSTCGADVYLDSAKIEIRDFAKLVIVPDTGFICPGNTIQLNATTGYANYAWNPNTTLSSLGIFNPIANPIVDSSKYYCTAVLGTCTAKDSSIIIYNNLKLKSKVDIKCKNGNDGSISVIHGKGWVAPLQFTLNGGAPQSDSTFNNLNAGTYTIQIKDAINCTKSIQVTLIQSFPDLTFTETINAPGCVTQGAINVIGNGGLAPYTYSLNNVLYQSSNSLLINNSGSFTVYIKDANNCVTPKTVLVATPSVITFTTTINDASCSGLADGKITINASGGSTPYQYSSDGGITYQNSNVLQVTNGSKIVFVKDALGCTTSKTILVPLNNTLLINPLNPATICEGKSIQINAFTNGTTNLWTPNLNILNPTTLTPIVTPNITTKYYIATTTGICSKIDSVLITVLPAPVPIVSNDTTICFGDAISIFGAGGTQFEWMPNSNINFTSINNPIVNPTQLTKYYLYVTDANGCKSLFADTVTISVVPKVIAFAGNDTLVATNQPIQLNATANAINFLWSPSIYLNTVNIANPLANIPIIGEFIYKVEATTVEGCLGTNTIKITTFKGPEIYVPTAFTPNGDNNNDQLKITAIGLKSFDYFRIFNRWGQLVFETKNPSNGWNGFYKNVKQPTGTFVWAVKGVDYNNKTIQLKGTLILIR